MSKATPLKKRGQERHSDRTAHTLYVTLLWVEIRLPVRLFRLVYSGLNGILYGKSDFDRVMLYIGLMLTACLKFRRGAGSPLKRTPCWGDNLGCRGKAPSLAEPTGTLQP